MLLVYNKVLAITRSFDKLGTQKFSLALSLWEKHLKTKVKWVCGKAEDVEVSLKNIYCKIPYNSKIVKSKLTKKCYKFTSMKLIIICLKASCLSSGATSYFHFVSIMHSLWICIIMHSLLICIIMHSLWIWLIMHKYALPMNWISTQLGSGQMRNHYLFDNNFREVSIRALVHLPQVLMHWVSIVLNGW